MINDPLAMANTDNDSVAGDYCDGVSPCQSWMSAPNIQIMEGGVALATVVGSVLIAPIGGAWRIRRGHIAHEYWPGSNVPWCLKLPIYSVTRV